jgi:hypothetical protein
MITIRPHPEVSSDRVVHPRKAYAGSEPGTECLMTERNPEEFVEHPELEDADGEEVPDLGDFEENLNG